MLLSADARLRAFAAERQLAAATPLLMMALPYAMLLKAFDSY
jgi:hypothetical protein